MKARQDFLIILMMGVLSAILIVGAGNLGSGSGLRMGSGSFPRLVGCLALLLAVAVGLRTLRRRWRPSEAALAIDLPAVRWRTLLSIAGGILAFALLVRGGGLAAASLLTVLACTFAQAYRHPGERLVLAAGLSAAAVLIFVYGLGLPFRILPAFL